MRAINKSFETDITSAYEELKVAYRDHKAKEQEAFDNELAAIRKKLVQGIKSCKGLPEEIIIEVREFKKNTLQQVISELNELGIQAKAQEYIDDEAWFRHVDIVGIIITTKSLDHFVEQQETPISKNKNIFFTSPSNAPNQDGAPVLQMR